MSLHTYILKPIDDNKKRKSLSMTDTNDASSSNNSNQNDQSDLSNNRRSQRRRTNVQNPMRSSSLVTTILTETNHHNQCSIEMSKENDQRKDERRSLPNATDKLVFSTWKTQSNASFWTVIDRQAEWYKLTIPIQQNNASTAKSDLSVTCRTLSNGWQRKKSNSNLHETAEKITDTTQLILKAVMNELDYDLDEEDLQYLTELNEDQKSHGERNLTEEELENALIILEYSAAEQIRLHLKQKSCEDENIVCDICLLPDADDGNEMVFCERCNACVHQNCYGISNIPSGTWLCKPCSIVRRPACLLCPKFGGPMKCTPSGTVWCHLTCALWLPELKFGDYSKMEPILNLHKIPHARWTLRCVVCSSSEGACVQCAQKNCRTPFHVTCGLCAGYFLDIQQASSDGTSSSPSQFNAYCSKHSDEARQRSEPDASEHSIPLTVYRRQLLRSEQWLGECYENLEKFVSSQHLHEQSPQEYDLDLSQKIHHYWKSKRKKSHSSPLIKRIDFILEQRENAELLLGQINYSLKIRGKVRQLQDYSQSTLYIPSFASALTERFESLRSQFHSSSKALPLPRPPVHSSLKSSKEYYQIIEDSKRCIVALEMTFRDGLELNTTYLVGETLQGETMLFPKQLMEQGNVIPIDEKDLLEEREENVARSPSPRPKTFEMKNIPYACHGNLVTCVTGSFD